MYSNNDVLRLQEDLNILSKWASDWHMTFNLNKCEHLVVSNICSPLYTEYRINNHSIHKVSLLNILGVIIDHNLSWSALIGAVSRKANGVLAFLQKNLKKCSSSIKSLAYFTYVRPILEYASIVWAPHTNCQIVTLEKIQCRAAGFVTDMLTLLNWASLEQRRNQAKCIMFYKILNNMVSVDFNHYLQQSVSHTRGHSIRFIQMQARVDVFLYSFLPSTTRLWNFLPADIVTSSTIDDFKNKLTLLNI